MKEYMIVSYKLVIDNPDEILGYEYGLAAEDDYDEILYTTTDREEAFDAFDENGSSYEFIDNVLYVTENQMRVHTLNENGEWDTLDEVYLNDAVIDDLDEAKEYAEAISGCSSAEVNVEQLLKAFVEHFGCDERGCYDMERHIWFSSKAVVDFIKEFAN